MQLIIDNPIFREDYQALARVSLNPERHTAENALVHCDLVVDRVKELAKLNHCSANEVGVLINLAYLHDIGKTMGTAKPEKSLELLQRYAEFEESFVNLVKYHDINLPWYLSHTKGEAPSHKAWAKLNRRVDIRLLCIFMIADRVDAPGGWQQNHALRWFLDQCKSRNLLNVEIRVEN